MTIHISTFWAGYVLGVVSLFALLIFLVLLGGGMKGGD